MRQFDLSSLARFVLPAVGLASAACARTNTLTNNGAADAPVAASTPIANASPSPAVSSSVAEVPKPLPVSSRRTDTISTSEGDLGITPIQHATLLLEHGGKAIYVDPTGDSNFDGLPKADVILVTDIHQDHLDPAGIAKIAGPDTVVMGPASVAEKTTVSVVIANGEKKSIGKLGVEAIPMYNLKRGPAPGKLFHDRGRGDGYVLTFGDKRVYVSGDTECTSEMRALSRIDAAFVCMNLPYTMPPSEAAECVNAFRPKVLFPYHFRGQNVEEFKAKFAVDAAVDVRIRAWYPQAVAVPTVAPTTAPKPGTPSRPRASQGAMCSGIAAIQCAEGLTCKMGPKPYPDQSGICVKP
jgi:L-ascorbate metabolism protein UlaG (beta-lactamase superfamily)